jgi:hypothetical protein
MQILLYTMSTLFLQINSNICLQTLCPKKIDITFQISTTYSQTCIKRLNSQEIFYDRTRKKVTF